MFPFFLHFDTNFDCWIVNFYVNFPFWFRSFSCFFFFSFLKWKCFVLNNAKREAHNKKKNLNMKSNTECWNTERRKIPRIYLYNIDVQKIFIFTCIFVQSERSTIHSKECKKFLLIFLFYFISFRIFVWSFVAAMLHRTIFTFSLSLYICVCVFCSLFLICYFYSRFASSFRIEKTENFIDVWLFEYSIFMRHVMLCNENNT